LVHNKKKQNTESQYLKVNDLQTVSADYENVPH